MRRMQQQETPVDDRKKLMNGNSFGCVSDRKTAKRRDCIFGMSGRDDAYSDFLF